MSGMKLLNTATDWKLHVSKFVKSNSLQDAAIDWNSQAPKSYPCLVATVLLSNCNVRSCIVYVAEAQKLVQAFDQMPRAVNARGNSIKLKTDKQPEAVSASGTESAPGHKKSYVVADLDDFHKHTAAMLMSIMQELTAIGISTEPRFEAAIAQNLARVDQFAASDRDSRTLSPNIGDRAILPKLYPPKTDEAEGD